MDTTTKRWMWVQLLLTLSLALIALGFVAMSTNIAIPSWIPLLFFALALVIILILLIFIIYNMLFIDRKSRVKRLAIANKLGEYFLKGEDIKKKFQEDKFKGDAVAMALEWSESLTKYFTDNPKELGLARLISLRPRQFDWYVYGQFDPLGRLGIAGKIDTRTYAFRHISIEMERLVDVMKEFV